MWGLVTVTQPINLSTSTTSPTFPYTINPSLTKTNFSYLFNLTMFKEPTSYKEACKYPKWVDAMDVELDALNKNNT